MLDPAHIFRYPRTITFNPRDLRLAVPDPRYLALHAACAKVAHLSGAGLYMDQVHRDMEELSVLSQDGSSADVLRYALLDHGEIEVNL